MKTPLRFALVALLALTLGWWLGRRPASPAAGGGERKVAFYQDSMHPWIKSDQPGKCTICGMDLTPVKEGEAGFTVGDGLLTLSPANVNVAGVRTEPAKRQSLTKTLHLAGAISVADAKRVFVSARLDGLVEKVHTENLIGTLTAGAPLAVVSGKALSDVQLEFIALERGVNLDKLLGGELERTRLLNLARERLKQFGFTDEEIAGLAKREKLATTMELRAPIGGTIVSRWIYDGMAVKEGQRLFEIVDLSSVWFKFDAYEGDMSWLAPQLAIEITTPSAPGQIFRGEITFLEPAIGDMVRTLKGRAELENPLVDESGRQRRLLRDREFAQGTVQIAAPGVLAIPRTAVLSPGGAATVYIEKGEGTYEPRVVKLGRTGDELVEVMSGLAEGEKVVAAGALLIDAQAQINQSATPARPGGEPPKAADVTVTKLTDLQERKATDVLGIAVTMASALSRDNADQYNQQIPALEKAMLPFIEAFAEVESLHGLVAAVEIQSHPQTAADLAAARKDFLAFSNALVDFAKAVRQVEALSFLKIYHCPMVNAAVPGAGKDGYWVQAAPPLRNPFFGAEMLECGVEVKSPGVQPAPEREVVPSPPVAAPTREKVPSGETPAPPKPAHSHYP